ncbi:4-alpha-glucanotransferase [Sphingomonas sp. S2-65]|uniref:4-alpha-glucanotransferase n=1 Tax=Sphingomonas sp. S2-65 TaxID=2903960 RepID=UPI001F3C6007|nr:4-alpha-glucanotransferase [Sphingomonas sp. S2-65]UYY59195.1 4-alpha-glucanotransferase [Sphingomonas sp. S2-65]
MTDQAVERLAEAAGISIDWEDAGGVARRVSPESLRLVLSGLGFACGSEAQCRDSAAALAQTAQPSCRVLLAGEAITGLSGTGQLVLEDGSRRDLDLSSEPRVGDIGYHRLEWSGGTLSLIVAPPRCIEVAPGTRPWGTAAQIYGLRDENPFGDFGSLADFVTQAQKVGSDAVMMSPVHALFTTDPGRYSPYSPSSRHFLNPWFADAGRDWFEGDAAALIDWQAAVPAKLAALRALYAGKRDDPAFRSFIAAADISLIDHARFEALHAHFFAASGARGWQDWPERYRRPGSLAVAQFAREHADEVEFHLFLQWWTDRSLARAGEAAKGMAVGLVTDLAVGLDAGGSHAWSRGEELMLGIGIGAPPDAFQAAGQNWGITSFSPFALQRMDYRPFIDLMRSAMRHAGGIRIDHALGLRRLWVVPTGASPLEGAYLRFPEQDILRLIALESHRARALVIGEDLGVVPPGFRDAISERGLMGMRVLPFERDQAGDFTPSAGWDEQAAALTSTHDLTPIAGWWQGRDIDWREQLGAAGDREAERAERVADRSRLWQACEDAGVAEGPEPAPDQPEAALDAAIAFAAQAPSALLIVPAEDLFGLDEAPNLPGTVDEHPNWRRRLPDRADALFVRDDVSRRLSLIREARKS